MYANYLFFNYIKVGYINFTHVVLVVILIIIKKKQGMFVVVEDDT